MECVKSGANSPYLLEKHQILKYDGIQSHLIRVDESLCVHFHLVPLQF